MQAMHVTRDIIMTSHTGPLSSTMHACRWIQAQHANHRSESWRNGMEEYLKYAKEIQTKFPVALDKQAPGTGTCRACVQQVHVIGNTCQAAELVAILLTER